MLLQTGSGYSGSRCPRTAPHWRSRTGMSALEDDGSAKQEAFCMVEQQRSFRTGTGRRLSHHPPGRAIGRRTRAAPPAGRVLTPEQVAAIRSVMRLFVEDDLANGVSASKRMYCDACQQPQQALGFIQYDRHLLCNACAVEYEVARARGLALSAGQFVRDKAFGEAEAYALTTLEVD
jgi:hypothetical protein